jgi:DNA-binding CsgD family transcriptional regulator
MQVSRSLFFYIELFHFLINVSLKLPIGANSSTNPRIVCTEEAHWELLICRWIMLNTTSPYFLHPSETIVDLAVSCVDYTDSLEQCSKLPFVLSRALNIDCIAFSIACESMRNLLLAAAFGHHPAFSSPEAARDLLERINRQLLPHSENRPPDAFKSFHARQLGQPLEAAEPAQFDGHSRVVVLSAEIDPHHRLTLIAHKRFGNLAISTETFGDLCILTRELSKQIRSTLAWQSPHTLGPPFDSLTEPELRTMAELKSELSEKQIAIKLDMSPHTLHAHIKSIYRKVGVQGRLALLLRLNAARKKSRFEAHTASS